MSRFWDCCVAGCSHAAAIDIGCCKQCSSHFCVEHVASPEHTCKEEMDDAAWEAALTNELKTLRQRINVTSLLKFASRANGDSPCSLDDLDDLSTCKLGGMHIHLRIKFATGMTWLARVPRLNEGTVSDDLTNRMLLNECATLKWLERIDMPSPHLHGYALCGEAQNDVGVAFMLIDELPGTPFHRYSATEEQLVRVYSQWANLLEKLSQHAFDKIGSLRINPSGTIEVGPIVGDRAGTLDHLGPFDTGRDFYIALTDEYLRLIADKQVAGQFSVDAYLMMKYIRSMLEDATSSPVVPAHDEGPFYLKHTDDKGDHLLVDEDYNICGVIDWSFARLVPAYEAFGPSLLTADMGDIFSNIGRPSRGDELLSGCLRTKGGFIAQFAQLDDRIRRFHFNIGVGIDVTRDEALTLFRGILAIVGKADTCTSWEEWRRDKIGEWAGEDLTLNSLIDHED